MKVRDLIKLVESKPKIVTIAGKGGDDVPAGTLKGILKAAGLEET